MSAFRRLPPLHLLGRLALAGVLWLALLAVHGVGRADAAPLYQVVVNSANPVTAMSRGDVAKLFLRKTSSWSTGGEVQPVDLAEDSEVRRVFSDRVIGKSVAAVKGYWQERIFTGRGVPPVEKGSDAEVLAYVAANRNAVGYVSGAATLPAGVKSIALQE